MHKRLGKRIYPSEQNGCLPLKRKKRNTNICLEMKMKEEAFLSVKSKLLTKIFKIVTMWLMMYCCYLLRISLGF